jgi:lipoate synthase
MFLIGNTIDRLKNKYHTMLKLVKSKKSHPQSNMTKANIVMGLSTGY